jgi:alpha-D-ribose 1-methylphosphonate 5-triphosphate diphosphatase
MPSEFYLKNAKVVMPDEIITGVVLVRDGFIGDVQSGGTGLAAALDMEGDYLVPGLVELHTDNLEKHVMPRPGVLWPVMPALLIHDAQIAAAGVTTVLDALCIGMSGTGVRSFKIVTDTITQLENGQTNGIFRAEHLLHLRLELSSEKTVDEFSQLAAHPLLRLVSLMDHTPGQRQWRDMSKYVEFNKERLNRTEEEVSAFLKEQFARQEKYSEANRKTVISMLRHRKIALASHDDTLPSHVMQAHQEGIKISEFPTTVEAASQAKEHGMSVIAGAPNVVLGGSHSGNVSAEELVRRGLLDAFSSDYVPSSLLEATFLLAGKLSLPLHQTIKLVTSTPASLIGLDDRGRIEAGKRADLVRVRTLDELPLPMTVWRQGERVV